MPVNPQEAQQAAEFRPYIPGQTLKPGETIVPGPHGPVIVPRDYSAPPPPPGAGVPGALPPGQPPIPPRVETTAPTTAEKFGKPLPEGDILSISATSGKDRFIVRTQLPGMEAGRYQQSIMSEAEIHKIGGDIPIPSTGIYGFGAGTRWAPSPPSKEEKVKLPEELEDYPLRVQHAYEKGGIEAANKAIEQYNKYVERFTASAKAAKEKRIAEWIKADAEFHTQLSQLPKEIQDAYYKGGTKEYEKSIKEYNKSIEADIAEFEKTIKSKDFPADLREIYFKKGPEAYNQAVHKRIKELESDIFSADYPQELKDAYKKGGYEEFQKAYDKYMADHQAAMKKLEPYISRLPVTPVKADTPVSGKATAGKEPPGYLSDEYVIDVVSYLKDGKDIGTLKKVDVTDADINNAKKYIQVEKGVVKYTQEYFKERGWDTAIPMADFTRDISNKEIGQYAARVKEATDSYYEMAPEKRPSAIVKEVALSMIPIYGTYRYATQAKEGGFTGGEIATIAVSSIADFLILVPIVGQVSAAARGTYMAGQAGRYLSAGVRAREIAKAAGYATLAEIKAPFTAIAHPIQTLKVGLSPIETILRGKKIPLSAIETKWNTARIPIKMVGDEKATMVLRDTVTDAMIAGKEGKAVINGVEVTLSPAAINRLGKPVAISATPDIRPYMDGAVIGKGKQVTLESGRTIILGEGKDLYVSPTFHSRFAEATSGGMRIKDAVPGGLIIRDEKIMAQLAESGKPYAGTAEIEARFLKGVDLGVPSQYIITRTPYGKKLTLAVYGKAFTADELAKMKVIGSLDTIKQIFKAPIKVKGAATAKYNRLAEMAEERQLLNKQLRTAKGKAASELKARISKLDNGIQAAYQELRTVYGGSYRAPIRTAIFNTTGGVFRTPAGEPRKAVNVEYYESRLPKGPRLPTDAERPRITVKPPARRLPVAPIKGRKLPGVGRGRILPEAPRGRIPSKTPKGRIPPKPPRERLMVKPPYTRTVPEPPLTRIPPKPPGRRITPTSPRRAVVPPEKRVPPTPPKPPRVPPPPVKPPVTPPKPPIIRIPRTDAEKREVIKAAGGAAIAYVRGHPHGKGMWHVWYQPKTGVDPERIILYGRPPEGARIEKGTRSAYRSMQTLFGKAAIKRIILEDTGVVDTRIEFGGKSPQISFERDIISSKTPRISGRTPRITPKTPRLK